MEFLTFLMTNIRGVWLLPFIFTAFVLLSMFLFVGELPEYMRRYLLPSLVVFQLGLGLIIFWKELWHVCYIARNQKRPEEEKDPNFPNMPKSIAWTFFSMMIVWFIFFIVYNYWRGVF